MRRDVFDTGSRGEWNGDRSGSGRDGILSVIVIQAFLDIITRSPTWNPVIVGEDNPIVSRIPFAEAVVDVVRCAWAIPDHPRTPVEMAFLFWVRACRGGDGRSGIALWWRGGILLQWRGGILAGRGGILLWRGDVLLRWGVGCGGSSMCILVDDASEYVLHLPQGILKYRYRVLRFDYNGGWWWCTEGRGNGEDGGDASLSNSAD
jgi:hypothetical protein